MIMSVRYTRVGWQDAPSTDTPIDAANLNHMDNGILALSEEVDTELPLLQEQINDISTDIDTHIDEKIPPEVSSWLTEHVDPVGSAVVVDDSLTIQGAAADAKKAGDEISGLKEDLAQNRVFSLLSEADYQSATSKSDNGAYFTSRMYKAAYLQKVTVRVNSDTDKQVTIYIYRKNGTSAVYVFEVSGTGHGEFDIPIDRIIPFDFYISIRGNSVAYKTMTSGEWYTVASGAGTITIPTSGNRYYHAFKVYLRSINDELSYQTPVMLHHSDITRIISPHKYPIQFDFINNKVKITNVYRADIVGQSHLNSEISITVSSACYVMLLFNYQTYSLGVKYSSEYPHATDYCSLIAFVYYNPTNYSLRIGNVNSNLIVCKIPTGDTNTDSSSYNNDIPKYSEWRFITSENIKSQWFGTKITFFGDSICKGENPENSYLRMPNDNVAVICAEEFGLAHSVNLGVGGARVASVSAKSLINRYTDIDTESDLVVIMGGTNDFLGGSPLGSMTDVSDNTQFIPAYYNLINGIRTRMPSKKMLAVIPFHQAYISAYNGPYLDESTQNSVGLTLADYRDAIIEVCKKCGVPYLDTWTAENGDPHNSIWVSAYQPDGLHFNINGMRRFVGTALISKIKEIYPSIYWDYQFI